MIERERESARTGTRQQPNPSQHLFFSVSEISVSNAERRRRFSRTELTSTEITPAVTLEIVPIQSSRAVCCLPPIHLPFLLHVLILVSPLSPCLSSVSSPLGIRATVSLIPICAIHCTDTISSVISCHQHRSFDYGEIIEKTVSLFCLFIEEGKHTMSYSICVSQYFSSRLKCLTKFAPTHPEGFKISATEQWINHESVHWAATKKRSVLFPVASVAL